MKNLIAYYTDKGIRKEANEDALLIRSASSDFGEILFAAVCDGMGGLNRGELASSSLVQSLSDWFDDKLPVLLKKGYDFITLKSGLEFEIRRQSKQMESYARRNGIRMGTTVTLILAVGKRALIANVGDSRIYEVSQKLTQITKDQSFVQTEVDAGRLSAEEAEKDSRRNILLQCVGESSNLSPAISEIQLNSNAVYLLCSDGFHHELSSDELCNAILGGAAKGEAGLTKALEKLVYLVMNRGELDNITAVALQIA